MKKVIILMLFLSVQSVNAQTVLSSQLPVGGVQNQHLENNAVTSLKIKDGDVSAADLADSYEPDAGNPGTDGHCWKSTITGTRSWGDCGSGGATNLGYTASTRLLTSDTGTDVTLPEVVAAGDSGLMTGADKTKVDGISTGATTNDTDANLLNRANHTGTQAVSTISDLDADAATLTIGASATVIGDNNGDQDLSSLADFSIVHVVADTTARDALSVPSGAYAFTLDTSSYFLFTASWASSGTPNVVNYVGTASEATVLAALPAGIEIVYIDTDEVPAAPEGTDVLSTGELGGTKFLREDGDGTSSWQTIAGGGDALVANPLSQFAATTSAQLAGVVSDETGTGVVVLSTDPVLVTPNLGTPSSVVLTNATGTASGLTAGNVTTNANLTGDVTSVGNATTISAGSVEVAMIDATGTASATTYYRGDGSWSALSDSESFVLETATVDDDIHIRANGALTLTSLDCLAYGATTPSAVVVNVMECTSDNGSCVASGLSVTVSALDSNQEDLTVTDAAIDDGDYWGIDIASLTTAPDYLSCTVGFTR